MYSNIDIECEKYWGSINIQNPIKTLKYFSVSIYLFLNTFIFLSLCFHQKRSALYIVRVIEQCCFNSVPDHVNGQIVNFILKSPNNDCLGIERICNAIETTLCSVTLRDRALILQYWRNTLEKMQIYKDYNDPSKNVFT